MPSHKSGRARTTAKPDGGFRISNGPVIHLHHEQINENAKIAEFPRIQGAPRLFAIARDPQTIFVYWEVDWPDIFAGISPADRRVHIRLLRENQTEESRTGVEPMVGSCFLPVSHSDAAYSVEIGYYGPQNDWHSVAISEQVNMPSDGISNDREVDLATIPFHLRFQRLIDLFRAPRAAALTEFISGLQRRLTTDDHLAVVAKEEAEVLKAMNLSLEQIRASHRALLDTSTENALRKRAEALLGFHVTSPAGGFSPSSW